MNRLKLQRRTALAAKISDRHNPTYKLVCTSTRVSIASASTRDEIREVKRNYAGPCKPVHIERRTMQGTYERIR